MLWGPRLQEFALAAGPCAGLLKQFNSGGVGLPSPTFQWIFVLRFTFLSLKYITKETGPGREGRRIFQIWGVGEGSSSGASHLGLCSGLGARWGRVPGLEAGRTGQGTGALVLLVF